MTKISSMEKKTNFEVNFDFTTDVDGFWEEFWSNPDGLGHVTSKNDPDSQSKKLQEYHLLVWNKRIFNNELQARSDINGNLYFSYKELNLSSDSIINSYRYKSLVFNLKEEMKKKGENYKSFQEEYIKKSYNIGGMIIFPKHPNSLNQKRGMHNKIRDRFDLTLECIRRYYEQSKNYNPLQDVLQADEKYYNFFGSFKGFIDTFFLQDWVDKYYRVKFMLDFDNFQTSPLPQNYDEYMILHDKQLELVQKRNCRIDKFIKSE